MRTKNRDILGNDVSRPIYDKYLHSYHMDIDEDISQKLFSKISKLSGLEYNSGLFGLALAQWMTKSLDDNILLEVEKIIIDEVDIQLWKESGATDLTIKYRSKELLKFLKKIKTPRKKALVRKPIKPLETIYNNGACLSFQLENNNYLGFVIFKEELFEKNGFLNIAFTMINQPTEPTLEDFLNTSFMYCNWDKALDEITGQEHDVAGISGFWVSYTGKKELANFKYLMDSSFSKVGDLKPFNNGYHSTSSLIQSGFKETKENLMNDLRWSINYNLNVKLDQTIFHSCSIPLKDFHKPR